MNCPICGRELKADDLLTLTYVPTQDWWVTRHLVVLKEGEDFIEQYQVYTTRYRLFCAQANIQGVVGLANQLYPTIQQHPTQERVWTNEKIKQK